MGGMLSGLGGSIQAEQALKGNRLDGKVAVVTGGSSGIGLETVRVLAKAGARVIIACPKPEKGEAAVTSVRQNLGSDPKVSTMQLDLSSFRSIRAFADKIIKEQGRVDLLVLNAAVMQCPQWYSHEGYEFQTAVNYLGHVLLAKLLIEGLMLGQELESRVIVVTCKLPLENPRLLVWRDLNFKTRPYSSTAAYSQSKIALAVWGKELARRLAGTNTSVHIVHPGVAVTNLNRFLPFFSTIYDMFVAPFVKTVAQAAATTIHCCATPDMSRTGNGRFYMNCRVASTPAVMDNPTLGAQLWKKTEELIETAKIDSHQVVDYNAGKAVFRRFQDLFVTPAMMSLGLAGKGKSP